MTVVDARADTLLPFRHLRWRSTVVALAATAAPVCGTTLWLSERGGHPAWALLLTLIVAAAAAVLSWRVMTCRVELEPDRVRVWNLVDRDRSVHRDRVRRAVVRAVHAPDGRSVVHHLFLLDDAGGTVFRMCDRWWTAEHIDAIAHHFEVPVEASTEPVHMSELRRSVPAQLLWHERHPVIARTAAVVGGAAGCLLIGWLAVLSV